MKRREMLTPEHGRAALQCGHQVWCYCRLCLCVCVCVCVGGGGGGRGVVTCCTHKGGLRDSLLKQEGQRSKLELSSSMLW